MNNVKFIIAALLAMTLAASQAANAAVAGNVQFVHGSVNVTNAAARTQALRKGDAVHESDLVTTTKGASAQIKMLDGGYLVIRPDSQLKFDSFVFSGEQDGSEQSFFSLLKGGIRAITGMIGQMHKANYRITTPSATIGIRGTDHETYVVTPDSPLAAVAPVGTYNRVNVGETTITTEKGIISVLPNQMGFAGAADQLPQLQPVNLNLFSVTPAPLAQGKGSNAEVRTSAVVDAAISGQDAGPENTVPKRDMQIPITGRSGGQTAPPITF